MLVYQIFGVVLIAESPLGVRVWRATWGTGSGSKIREEIATEERRTKLWIISGA